MSNNNSTTKFFKNSLNKFSMFNQIGDADETLKGLPRGEVGLLVAPGATGKSYFVLNLMLASLKLTSNHLIDNTKNIKTLYVSLEDRLDDINRRMINYKNALGIQDINQLKVINDNFEIIAYKGADRLISKGIKSSNNQLWIELKQNILNNKSDLVIIDTFIKTYEGFDENSNPDMAKVLSYFNELAIDCNCSILLLHHTNKGAINPKNESSQADSRGASSIVDNSRYVISLRNNDNSSGVICKGVKTNFSRLSEVTYNRKYKGSLIMENNHAA